MIRIAICDDERTIVSQIEKTLLEYSKSISLKSDITVFYSGEELLKFIESDHGFDLIYLDIEMESMNGLEVGKKIRNTMKDHRTEIVYISGKDGYDRQLFDVQPLHFIPKPIDPKIVIKDLELAILRGEEFGGKFTYKKGSETFKLPIEDIIYFESVDRKIKIVTTRYADTFYGKINQIFENVAKYRFIKIHRSYIVNYKHIAIFKYDEVVMSNEAILPISQGKRKKVRDIQLSIEKGGVNSES